MGKGERRGRVGRRAAHNRRRRHHRHTGGRGGAGSLFTTSGGAGGAQLTPTQVLQRRVGGFAFLLLIPGITLTVMFHGDDFGAAYAGYAMLGIAGALILLSWVLQCKAKQEVTNAAPQPQVQQMEGGAVVMQHGDATTMLHALTVIGLQQQMQSNPNQTQQYPNFSTGQPFSQPYPDPAYPDPATAAGFGGAPTAPPPPPQYGFTYNNPDAYNTQYSSGPSDMPPPPAYHEVVNEKH